jgi:hypothetical protein
MKKNSLHVNAVIPETAPCERCGRFQNEGGGPKHTLFTQCSFHAVSKRESLITFFTRHSGGPLPSKKHKPFTQDYCCEVSHGPFACQTHNFTLDFHTPLIPHHKVTLYHVDKGIFTLQSQELSQTPPYETHTCFTTFQTD